MRIFLGLVLLIAAGCQLPTSQTAGGGRSQSPDPIVDPPAPLVLTLGLTPVTATAEDGVNPNYYVGTGVDADGRYQSTPLDFGGGYAFTPAADNAVTTTVALVSSQEELAQLLPGADDSLSSHAVTVIVKSVIPVGTFTAAPTQLKEGAGHLSGGSEFYYYYGRGFVSSAVIAPWIAHRFEFSFKNTADAASNYVRAAVLDAVKAMLETGGEPLLPEALADRLIASSNTGVSVTVGYSTGPLPTFGLVGDGAALKDEVELLSAALQDPERWFDVSNNVEEVTPYQDLELFAGYGELMEELGVVAGKAPFAAAWEAQWQALRTRLQPIAVSSTDAGLAAAADAAVDTVDAEVTKVLQHALDARAPAEDEFSDIFAAWAE